MKDRGFTLVEVLAIIVVLGIIATIATPIVQTTIKQNREKMYNVIKNQLIDTSKDWAAKNASRLPDTEGESVEITLGELKTSGLLRINVSNPNTNKIFSNESYVRITRKNNNFIYGVITYDLIDANEVEEGAPVITLNGSQVINLNVGEVYVEPGVVENKPVSIQIVKDGTEVSSVDTSQQSTYTIYYSVVENDKIGVNIRTVIVK